MHRNPVRDVRSAQSSVMLTVLSCGAPMFVADIVFLFKCIGISLWLHSSIGGGAVRTALEGAGYILIYFEQ